MYGGHNYYIHSNTKTASGFASGFPHSGNNKVAFVLVDSSMEGLVPERTGECENARNQKLNISEDSSSFSTLFLPEVTFRSERLPQTTHETTKVGSRSIRG